MENQSWTCPDCGFTQEGGAFCANCGRRKPAQSAQPEQPQPASAPSGTWICPTCGAPNAGTFCGDCGSLRPISASGIPVQVQVDAPASPEIPAYYQPQSYSPVEPTVVTNNGPSKGLAIAALVLGLVALLTFVSVALGLILGIAAIVLAAVFKSKGGRSGMSTAGIVLGVVSIIFSLVWALFIAALIVGTNSLQNIPLDLGEQIGSIEEQLQSFGKPEDTQKMAEDLLSDLINPYIKKESAAVSQLEQDLKDYWINTLGVSLDEVGVDSGEFTSWVLKDLSFNMNMVVDGKQGSSSQALGVVHMRDLGSFYRTVSDTWKETDLESFGSQQEALQALGNLITKTMAETDMVDHGITVALISENGTMKVQPDSWTKAYKNMFVLS